MRTTHDVSRPYRLPAIAVLASAIASWLTDGGPAFAESAATDQCVGLPSSAVEVACLRRALDASRAALARAQGGSAPHPSSEPRPGGAPSKAAAAMPQPAGLGAEQVARRPSDNDAGKQRRARLMAMAAPVATDHLGLFTLQLENGQVWRQTESAGTPLRLANGKRYPVEIAASGFGGYRMRFPGIGRQIVVKRLR